MADSPLKPSEVQQDATSEATKTREALGEQAFKPPAEAPEQATRVGNPTDRAELRQAVAVELSNVDKELKDASNAMKEVNLAAQAGHKPGSQKYEEGFQKAIDAYLKVIRRCEGNLCQFESDNKTRKVDATTGVAKRSPFALGLEQESNLLGTEIDQLQQIHKTGRPLTQAEMGALGVTSNDTRAVLEERIQQRKNVIDLGRSLGYAEANLGLALIRSSANLQGADKTAQAQQGALLLDQAAIDDKLMAGPPRDPNFAKHLQNVVDKAGLTVDARGLLVAREPGPALQPGVEKSARPVDRTGVPATPVDRTGVPATPGQPPRNEAAFFGGRSVVKDGTFTLPSDNVDIAQPGFRNPFELVAAIDGTQPLSATSLSGYKQAIEAADSLDRVKIKQYMGEANKVVNDAIANAPVGSPFRRTYEQIQRNDLVMNQLTGKMSQSIPQLEAIGGKPAGDIITYLRGAKDIHELNAKLSHPQNADAIRAFKGLKDAEGKVIGAVYVADLQAFMNGKATKTQLETNLIGLNPNYGNALADLSKLDALHHSSEYTRAQYVRSVVADRRNLSVGDPPVFAGDATTKANAEQARKAVIELAIMKPKLLEDADFKSACSMLQISDETFRTGDYRLGQPAAPGTKTGALDSPISNAFAAYEAADAKALTPQLEQIFVSSLAEAKTIKTADIEAERAQLKASLEKTGWSLDPETPLEKAFNSHMTTVRDKFDKISPAQKDALAQLFVDAQNVTGPDEKSINDELTKIDGKIGALGQKDPDVAAWLDAREKQAQWAAATPQLQARLAYAEGLDTLANIEHGPQLIAGMYGRMLVKANRPADAAPYLLAAKGDPAVARMLPKVAELAQQVQERPAQPAPLPNTPKPADRSAELSLTAAPMSVDTTGGVGPLERPDVPAPVAAPADAAALAQKQEALQMAMDAVGFVQQNGKPLSEQTVDDVQDGKVVRSVKLEPVFLRALQINAGDPNGTAAGQTLYAAALASTGHAADIEKAKTVMKEAVKHPNLFAEFPQAANLAKTLGVEATNQRDVPAQAPAGPTLQETLLEVVPGFKDFQKAALLTDSKDLTWKQRMEQAEPLFNSAIKSADDILLPETNERFAQVGQQITELETQFNAMSDQQRNENPAQARQMQVDWLKLQKEAEILNVIRLQPMNSRLVYAFAANHYAADLKEQAAKDPANAAALEAEAKKYNELAVKHLKDVGNVDPTYGGDENAKRMVEGAIELASKGQKMERNPAIALGYGKVATEVMDFGKTPFASKEAPLYHRVVTSGAQPAVTAVNWSFEAFTLGEQVPYVGKFFGGFQKMSPANIQSEAVVQALAEAKNIDPASGKLIVDQGKMVNKTQLVRTGIDVIAAPSSIALTNRAIMPLIARYGSKTLAKNPLAALAVSWGTDVILTKGLDEVAHQGLNTERLTTSEWMTHSTLGIASAHTFNRFMGARAATSAKGVAALGDDVVIAGEKMVGKTPASFITQVETKIAARAQADIAAGVKPGSVFAEGRSSMTFFEKVRHPFSTKGPTGALMTKAELEVATNGIATGSRWSYLKPSNVWNAATGKPGNFVTNDAGAQVFTGTLRDLRATQLISKWGSLTTAGGLASAAYSPADVNFWDAKKADGSSYTVGETFSAMGERGLTGMVATGVAAPLVPVIGKFSYKLGVVVPVKVVTSPLQWLAKADATKALTPLADDAGRLSKLWHSTKEAAHWVGNTTRVNTGREYIGLAANKLAEKAGVTGAGGKISDKISSVGNTALNGLARTAYPNLGDDGARWVAPEIARPWLSNYVNGNARQFSEAAAGGHGWLKWHQMDKASDQVIEQSNARIAAAEAQAKEEQEAAARKAEEQKQATKPATTQP